MKRRGFILGLKTFWTIDNYKPTIDSIHNINNTGKAKSNGTPRNKEQRRSHQEEPGSDLGFSRDSTTLKPIQARPSEPYFKNSLLLREIDKEREE